MRDQTGVAFSGWRAGLARSEFVCFPVRTDTIYWQLIPIPFTKLTYFASSAYSQGTAWHDVNTTTRSAAVVALQQDADTRTNTSSSVAGSRFVLSVSTVKGPVCNVWRNTQWEGHEMENENNTRISNNRSFFYYFYYLGFYLFCVVLLNVWGVCSVARQFRRHLFSHNWQKFSCFYKLEYVVLRVLQQKLQLKCLFSVMWRGVEWAALRHDVNKMIHSFSHSFP